MADYREFAATPSPTGGKDGGKLHRLYAEAPRGKERFDLLSAGWKPVDLSTGHYANTKLKVEALKISNAGAGLVYVQG